MINELYIYFKLEVNMKTAILVHGYHLSGDGWEDVEWGTPPLKGRIPKAFEMIMLENPAIVVFGSGASVSPCGECVEGEYIRQELVNSFDTKLQHYFPDDKVSIKYWKRKIYDIARTDTTSTCTVEELQFMRTMVEIYSIEKLLLISSPTHLPRCIRDAHTIFSDCPTLKVLCGVPSDTCYPETTANDVVIIEPPHRKDRSCVPIHKTASKILHVPAEKQEEFRSRLEDLLTEYM